jgi:hypothetical protein
VSEKGISDNKSYFLFLPHSEQRCEHSKKIELCGRGASYKFNLGTQRVWIARRKLVLSEKVILNTVTN